MNWFKKAKFAAQVQPFDMENDDHFFTDEYDAYEREHQADQAFDAANLRYDSSKRISHVAIEDGRVIGALASGWTQSQDYGDEKVMVFAFDVAVRPEFQKGMTGLKLIAGGIQKYETEKRDYQEMGYQTMMRLCVVNSRLVPVLEQRYGFTMESDHGAGGVHLVRY